MDPKVMDVADQTVVHPSGLQKTPIFEIIDP